MGSFVVTGQLLSGHMDRLNVHEGRDVRGALQKEKESSGALLLKEQHPWDRIQTKKTLDQKLQEFYMTGFS